MFYPETDLVISNNIGKTIVQLSINAQYEDKLLFKFSDDTSIVVYDNGQTCCESRYMTCDDDLDSFVNSELLGIEVRDADNIESSYGEHEVQFLVVTTSKGCFTCETHNEHNGWYGGFSIVAYEV